jgi:hypothetical protein
MIIEDQLNDISDATFSVLKRECKELLRLRQQEEDLFKQTKDAHDRILKLERETLPTLMAELDIPSIAIGNHLIEISDLVSAKLPEDPVKRDDAIDYFVESNNGGVVKRRLSIELPPGDAVLAERIVAAVRAVSSVPIKIDRTIHHSTYSSVIRKMVERGEDVPLQRVNCYIAQIAKVTQT